MKTMYQRWEDEEIKNLSTFMTRLFQAYQYGDGTNRRKLDESFPEYFVEKR